MHEETIFNIIHNMDQFTNQLIVQWNQTFNEELGISHILILSHLSVDGRSRPSDIAKSIGLTPPTVTHLCEKLVQKNLVERSKDDDDRRMIYINITELGKKTLERANQAGQTLRRKLFEKLTDEEQQQLLHIYKRMNKNRS